MAARPPHSDLLRPSLFVLVAAAHAAAFGYGSWRAQPLVAAPRLSIEVTLASPPPAMEAAPADEAMLQEAPVEAPVEPPVEAPPVETVEAPVETRPTETPPERLPETPQEPEPPPPEPTRETPAETPPEPEPELKPEPPAVITATPPPRPEAAPFVAPPAKPTVRKKPAEVRKPVAKPKSKPAPRVAKPAPTRARAAPQTAGSESRAPASVASTAQYGAVIAAAIRSRTVFPQSARGSGGGVVYVAFVIGPGGRTQSASVVRSSGESALDRAALAAVRGVSAPPPPGGRYAATAPIRFSLQ